MSILDENILNEIAADSDAILDHDFKAVMDKAVMLLVKARDTHRVDPRRWELLNRASALVAISIKATELAIDLNKAAGRK